MIRIPVYSAPGDIPRIDIYSVLDDGTFERTNLQHFNAHAMRESMAGIGPAQGWLVGAPQQREPHPWRTPTVEPDHGEPQSLCRFLREQTRARRLFVFTLPSLDGRLASMELHQLELKPHMTHNALALFTRKYLEATKLELDWIEGWDRRAAQDKARALAARFRRMRAAGRAPAAQAKGAKTR